MTYSTLSVIQNKSTVMCLFIVYFLIQLALPLSFSLARALTHMHGNQTVCAIVVRAVFLTLGRRRARSIKNHRERVLPKYYAQMRRHKHTYIHTHTSRIHIGDFLTLLNLMINAFRFGRFRSYNNFSAQMCGFDGGDSIFAFRRSSSLFPVPIFFYIIVRTIYGMHCSCLG